MRRIPATILLTSALILSFAAGYAFAIREINQQISQGNFHVFDYAGSEVIAFGYLP